MVDYAEITVKAGDGGDGMMHLRHEKYRPKAGPDGGDGGNGGSVYIETDTNLNTLSEFRYRKEFAAEDGDKGFLNKRTGKQGEDLVIKVPVGTLVKTEGKKWDLNKEGMKVRIASGGAGGKGNWRFRSATNQTPREFEEGIKREKMKLTLELKLLADIGLIGLPNGGKSTLLSVLTKARPVIANYPFTTLEPNLGVMEVREKNRVKSVVIADIPGLIEGASEGKGLGDEFLKHVERTKKLVHVVAGGLGRSGKELWEDYQTIREELSKYNKKLLRKKEMVVISKTDLMGEEEREEVQKVFEKKGVMVRLISAAIGEGIEELKKELI